MDAVPDGMCLAAVVACGQEERELFVTQLAQEMLPQEHRTARGERRFLVEAGLWMFALFDSEHALQRFRNPGEKNAGVIED